MWQETRNEEVKHHLLPDIKYVTNFAENITKFAAMAARQNTLDQPRLCESAALQAEQHILESIAELVTRC